MRSDWTGAGPKPTDRVPARAKDMEVQRGGHVKMRAEIGGMPLQAGEPRGLLADPASSEGGRDSVSPQALCGHTALRTPTPRPGPRDCEWLHLRGLSGLGCGPSRGSARTQTWTDRPEDAAVSTGGSPAPWSGRARVQLQTDQQLGPAGPARLPSIPPCTGTPAPTWHLLPQTPPRPDLTENAHLCRAPR